MTTIVDTTPPPVPQLPRIEPTDILRAAGHMGIGSAAGHALAGQLMAAAELARAKGAELSHRMRTEAQEIRTAHQRANELNGDHWTSEAGRAYRRQLEEHREKVRNQAEQAENAAAMIAAAGEELANDLTAKAQAIKAAASAVDNRNHRPLRRAKSPVSARFTHAREPARRAELAHPNPLTSP